MAGYGNLEFRILVNQIYAMNYVSIIGILAAFFTMLANIPQAYKIIKEKKTAGVSSYTYSILIIGNGLWLTYGILQKDWPLLVANSITLLTCCIILALKIYLPKK